MFALGIQFTNPKDPYVRVGYSSYKQPRTTYEINLETGERHERKVESIPGYDPSAYEVKVINVDGHDGAQIPVSMVYKKDTFTPGKPQPLFLRAYGSYGIRYATNFKPPIFSLLDRGFIFATAHVRGGTDKGFGWYLDGKLFNKKNTFLDTISVTEALVAGSYTTPDMTVLYGGSAGGLVTGFCANNRPDLFHIVVSDVPFFEVMNDMLDKSLPLTAGEWNEWGNPEDKNSFEYIRSYDPYYNIRPQRYPHMLMLSAMQDYRVPYWEPLKFAQKLRATRTGLGLTLCYIDDVAGHGGKTGRYEAYEEDAQMYAYILELLKVKTKEG
jgi:oligopeptidase B